MTNFHEVESDTINRLADKLATLQLADDEKAALDMILDRAGDADGDVAGFDFEPGSSDLARERTRKIAAPDLTVGGLRIASALGLGG